MAVSNRRELLEDFIKIEVFRCGDFLLKSGTRSPVYIDLRSIISYPSILKQVAICARDIQVHNKIPADLVCGIPYTALPIASILSVLFDVPMAMKRKEAKNYGTCKMVEGVWKTGSKCLIIEDIVTSGGSVIETVECLKKSGLEVTDCIVIVDRLQGARENLSKMGIRLFSMFDLNEVFATYCRLKSPSKDMIDSVNRYLSTNVFIPVKGMELLPYSERAKMCKNQLSKTLFELMSEKETNLCVAADFSTSEHLLQLADKVGPHICILKTHIDILTDFTPEVVSSLKSLSKKHNFLILEDRKFADIGNTVFGQYANGMYHIQDWADIVTVHAIPGDGIIEALKQGAGSKGERACVLIAEMSSKGSLTDTSYSSKVHEMALLHSDFVLGFITQHGLTKDPSFINISPGVHITSAGDFLGQQYRSPEQAVADGADIIIVGRGISQAVDPEIAAAMYKSRSYEAYKKKC